ncbi:MAG: type 4a pilus biogenesis protein PilO [Acidimicrobiales bacterium]
MSASSPTVAVLRRPKVMLGIAVALVVVLAWLMAFFVPQGRKLSSLQLQEQSLQQQVNGGNAKVVRLRDESHHSAQIAAMVKKLEGYVPATSDISYIALFSNTAKANGVSVTSIGPGSATPVTGSSFQSIPVAATVTGPYDNLLSFVRAIYVMPRLTDIDSVQLSGGGPKTNRGTVLTATFQLQIFTSQKAAG